MLVLPANILVNIRIVCPFHTMNRNHLQLWLFVRGSGLLLASYTSLLFCQLVKKELQRKVPQK